MIMVLEVILLEIAMPMKMKAILSMIVAMMAKLLIMIMEVPVLKPMMRSSSYEETMKVMSMSLMIMVMMMMMMTMHS